jgi:hypothetical protein
LRLAAGNAWNLAALAACGGLAFLTQNPVPLVAGAALEAGWLALATRPRASALFFASHHAEAARVSARAHRAALVASLSESDRDRVRRLEERQAELVRRCDGHRYLERESLLPEVGRLADVVDGFLERRSGSGFAGATAPLERIERSFARIADEITDVRSEGELRGLLDDALEAPESPAVPPSEHEDRARRRPPLPASVATARRG